MANYLPKETQPFTVLEHLGTDKYESVSLVNHVYLGKVAYKTSSEKERLDSRAIAELKEEASRYEKLRHQNIVILYETVFDSPCIGIFREYMKYGAVDKFLEKFKVSAEWRIQILHETASALSYLHRQNPVIIHKGLSCEYILIGDGFHAKISDFSDILSSCKTSHIAPEYFFNPSKEKSERFDVYSFAISAWEILSQKRAYYNIPVNSVEEFVKGGGRPEMGDINIAIQDSIKTLLEGCWHKKERRRLPAFEKLKDNLSAFLLEEQLELVMSYSNLTEQEKLMALMASLVSDEQHEKSESTECRQKLGSVQGEDSPCAYQILEQLGDDGYCSAYLVQHDQLGTVVFKTLSTKSTITLTELSAEADIHRNLRHPNIVIFYEAQFSPTVCGIFIEHMKYGSVQQFSNKFLVSPEWRIHILYDTASAISYLHEQEPPIIHGSLSCQNILIGEGFRAKISDFGLARILSENYCGTVEKTKLRGNSIYIAPEYFSNPNRRKSAEFDVYSFAISAWKILSQKVAYPNCNNKALIPIFVERGGRPDMEDLNISIPDNIKQLITDGWQGDEIKRPKFNTIKDILFAHISQIQPELKLSYSSLIEQEKSRESTNTLTVMLEADTQEASDKNLSADVTCKEFKACKILLLEIIGQGGYSNVYKAKYVGEEDFEVIKKDKNVAYKKLKLEYIRDSDLGDLNNEAKLHCKLQHRNIIKCLGMIFEPGNYGIIMEFAEYGEVRNYLIKNNDLKIKQSMINDVALGMTYLHGLIPPVIHGDLKIQNVLVGVAADQKSIVAKLCDFGFSRLKNYSQSRSVDEVRLGTVTHIPPEYWNDNMLRKTEKFDVYSFGICAWEMITLERPFENANNNAGLIRNWVLSGQRPTFGIFESELRKPIIELIRECWGRVSGQRPSFESIVDKLSKYGTE